MRVRDWIMSAVLVICAIVLFVGMMLRGGGFLMIRLIAFVVVLALISAATSELARRMKVALWRRGKLTYSVGRAISYADLLIVVGFWFGVALWMGWGQ